VLLIFSVPGATRKRFVPWLVQARKTGWHAVLWNTVRQPLKFATVWVHRRCVSMRLTPKANSHCVSYLLTAHVCGFVMSTGFQRFSFTYSLVCAFQSTISYFYTFQIPSPVGSLLWVHCCWPDQRLLSALAGQSCVQRTTERSKLSFVYACSFKHQEVYVCIFSRRANKIRVFWDATVASIGK
jgi:hypothetical protein